MIKLHFDTSTFDKWHRIEVENMLSKAKEDGDYCFASSKSNADYIIDYTSTEFKGFPKSKYDPRIFTWDTSDFPSGLRSGLYCSLPRQLFRGRRHATHCYTVCWNECIEKHDLNEAALLGSFVGGLSTGLRGRIFKSTSLKNDPRFLIQESSGPWNAMFDRSGLTSKIRYAESIRKSKFVLCPRGNGVGSIRMFEVMQSQRVPVVLSDTYVPPNGIDWSACSIYIRENNMNELPKILRENESRFEELAVNARRVWEMNFSPSVTLQRVGSLITNLSQFSSTDLNLLTSNYIYTSKTRLKVMIGRLLIHNRISVCTNKN